MIGTGILTFLV